MGRIEINHRKSDRGLCGGVAASLLAFGVLCMAFVAVQPAALSAQSVSVAPGERYEGSRGIDARNDRVRVGDDAIVDGMVRTRNGVIAIGDRARVGLVESRNGRISIGAETLAATVSSRNGRISIGRGAEVAGVDSRNGRIDLAEGVQVLGSVETRNGAIRLAEDGWIDGDVRTRNGGIAAGSGTRIQGSVHSRNGSVRLEDTHVGRDIDVMAGNVRLLGSTSVDGDVIVLMSEHRGAPGWLPSWLVGTRNEPVLHIDSDVRIGGRLIVDERVRITIERGANVPEAEIYPSREAFPGTRGGR